MSVQADKNSATGPPGHLVVLAPGDLSVTPIPVGTTIVGRDASCDVILAGAAVSRRHCQLDFEPDGRHRVVDLGSTAGLFVNNVRVDVAELQPFDRLRVGEVELLYLDSRANPDEVLAVLAPRPWSDLTSLSPPEQVRRSLRERLTWLTLKFQELRTEDELAPLLDALVDELCREPACMRRIVVVLFDERTASGLRAVKLRDAPPDHVRSEALAAYTPLVRRALDADRVLEQSTPLGARTVCVPMRSHGRTSEAERRRYQPGSTRGALLIGSPGPSLNAEEKRLFRTLARQVAVLLSSVDLQRRATTDSLTTLANRSQTERIVRDELDQAEVSAVPLSLLLIDLDDFKQINDTHGHAAGDQVLREVGNLLRRTLRLTDSAGRWGGEEFLVILPGTDVDGATLVAEKVLQELRGTVAGPHRLTVCASIGVASYPHHGLEVASLVNSADQALYLAKEGGKDQLAVFDPGRVRRTFEHTQRLPLERPRGSEPLAWLSSDGRDPGPVSVGYTSIGRDFACDLCLTGDGVSGRHGLLQLKPNAEATYQDCSREGTFHNGARVEQSVPLAHGDQLTIGSHELVFELVVPEEGPGSASPSSREKTLRAEVPFGAGRLLAAPAARTRAAAVHPWEPSGTRTAQAHETVHAPEADHAPGAGHAREHARTTLETSLPAGKLAAVWLMLVAVAALFGVYAALLLAGAVFFGALLAIAWGALRARSRGSRAKARRVRPGWGQ